VSGGIVAAAWATIKRQSSGNLRINQHMRGWWWRGGNSRQNGALAAKKSA